MSRDRRIRSVSGRSSICAGQQGRSPHAACAKRWTSLFTDAPIYSNGDPHGLPGRFTGALTIEHRQPSCAGQA